MADVLRVTSVWQGIAGAPGVTNMHFGPGGGTLTEAADAATAAVRGFWEAIKANISTATTITVLQEVPQFNDADGHLTDVANASSPPVATTGTSVAAVAAPAGASVIWLTNVIRGTRRLRGRTYIVPMTTVAYEANGTIIAATLTTINTAATNLRSTAGVPFLVWGRPSPELPVGVAAPVSGHFLRDKVAVLRSRRD